MVAKSEISKSSSKDTWTWRLEELKEYKDFHGHCLVPRKYKENPGLGDWVSKQRTMYRRHLQIPNSPKHEAYCRNQDRITKLEKIGFVWSVAQEKWSTRYKELQQYHNIHGDTLVPSSYKENPALGKWVSMQRRLYAQQQTESNSKSWISLDRIKALNKLHFSWEMNSEGMLSSLRWNQRFEELCQYKSDHDGATDVPIDYQTNPQLGIWVNNQRLQYKLHHENNEKRESKSISMLTQERIQKLKSIGFSFDRHEDKWNQQYKKLQEFQMMNGHCLVPDYYASDLSLGAWVANQRSHYKYFQAGNKNTFLTPERIELLNKIGFCWSRDDNNWWNMLEQLKVYHAANDSFDIPSADLEHRKVRDWIKYQRAEYRKYLTLENNKNEDNYIESNYLVRSSSMTEARIEALENLGFVWEGIRARRRKDMGGPSVDDWSLLFNKLKEKGINKEAKAKEHIFDGEDRFVDGLKHSLDEDDLLSLWNEEEDDDEDGW